MAIVVGGRIINLPQENLSGILGGLGQIVSGIRNQRQAEKEIPALTNLARILGGELSPTGQAIGAAGAPGRATPLTDRNQRLTAINNLIASGQIKTPANLERLFGIAKLETKAIPTGTTRKPDRRNFTITNKDGREQKIKATDQEAAQIQTTLPQGSTITLGTPIATTGVTDLVQKAIRINSDGTESEVNARLSVIDADPSLRLLEPEKNPRRIVKITDPVTSKVRFVDKVELEAAGGAIPSTVSTSPSIKQQASRGTIQSDITSIRDQIAETGGNITPGELLLSRGALSGVRQGFANVFGSFLSGQQAPETTSARQQVAQLGFVLTTIIGNNKRFPEGERKAILKITTNTNAFFADPPSAIKDIRNFRALAEARNIADRNTLNTKTISGQKRKDLFDNIATRESAFLILPTLQELDYALEPIRNRDLTQLSRQDIDFIATHPIVADSLNEVQKRQVAQRASELGFTRGN